MFAFPRPRSSGSTAMRRLIMAALLGTTLILPVPSPSLAQARDSAHAESGKGAKNASTKTADKKVAAKPAEAKPPVGASLQLGLFSRESDAWWAWESLQRRQPELTKELTANVSFLDGKTEAGGVVLRAVTGNGVEPQRLCRRIVGAGFGCLIVDAPLTMTTTVTTDKPSPAPAPREVVAAAPTPSIATVPPASFPPSLAASTTVTVPVSPSASPVVQPTSVAVASAPSILAPIGSASAAPLVPPPAVAKAVTPAEGLVFYSEEDARTMADIEQHSRRKGRLRSVMPDSRLDVMPATLKLEKWNLCALTFDDGPHRTVTRQLLEVLNREGVRATYFPVGRVAANQGDLIRDFIASGHEIGNHSLTHSDLRAMDAEGQRYEIAETNRILRGFGANPVLFRPPYGRYSNELLAIARDEQMSSVLWTVDTRDWKVRNADKIVQHIKTAAGTGSVFLMHSTYPTTAQALPRVIAELREKGCEFVTLSEWLERMRMLALPKIVNAGMPVPPPASTPPVAAARN